MTPQQLQHNRLRLGQQFASIREEKGLTQIELAELAGLHQHNISRVESGRYAATLDVLTKIARALDCEVELVPQKDEK